jgi:uncharacterized protein
MEEFDNGLDKKLNFEFGEPVDSEVDVFKLKDFLTSDKDAVLVFYGGEPLMKIDKIKTIMDNINVPFRMQTNGLLLDKIETVYLRRIGKILVSLDGGKKITDENRGEGTFEKVKKNIKKIRDEGYDGEIVARMTVTTNSPNIFKNAVDLLKEGFSSVHWQVDAGFYKFDYDKEKISKFYGEYNTSVKKLVDFWVKKISEGVVIKLYPFLGIVESILKNEPTKIRCGAGHSGYAITTSGKIVACPIMNSIENFKAGSFDCLTNELKKFDVNGCENCGHRDLCGGRCMYWRAAKLWPKEGDEIICDSIKFYIDEIKSRVPQIKKLIKEGIISESDFEYEKYFGPEIIP